MFASVFILKDTVQHRKQITTPVLRTIQTLYGSFSVTEQVIVDLIDSKAVQRMKKIDQYGLFSQFNKKHASFSRYDHSIGVWAILKKYGASIEEQIAGLLHDTSHTVFSHVGDRVFKISDFKKSYQDKVHEWYLKQTEIPKILKKHNFDFDVVSDEKNAYLMLEQSRPDLCVDRIEYNLRGGLVDELVTKEDVQVMLNDLTFKDGKWFFNTKEIARKFSNIPLSLTENVWGSHDSCFIDSFLAVAVLRAMEIGLVSKEEIHFSTDDIVWGKLVKSKDSLIKDYVRFAKKYKELYAVYNHNNCDQVIKTKFAGVDPLVKQQDGSLVRLSSVDRTYAKDYLDVKNRMEKGWPVRILGELALRSEYQLAMFS